MLHGTVDWFMTESASKEGCLHHGMLDTPHACPCPILGLACVLNPMCTLGWGHAHHPTCTPGAHSRLHLHLISYDKCLLSQNWEELMILLHDSGAFSWVVFCLAPSSGLCNLFLPSCAEVFKINEGKQPSSFIHVSTWHGQWSASKGFEGPPFFIHSFYRQRVLMAFQRVQVVTILCHSCDSKSDFF